MLPPGRPPWPVAGRRPGSVNSGQNRPLQIQGMSRQIRVRLTGGRGFQVHSCLQRPAEARLPAREPTIKRDVRHRRDSDGPRGKLHCNAYSSARHGAGRKAHDGVPAKATVRLGQDPGPAASRPVLGMEREGGAGGSRPSRRPAPTRRGPYRTTCENPWVRLRRAAGTRTQPSPDQ